MKLQTEKGRIQLTSDVFSNLTGGAASAAGGITAAIFLGVVVALIFKPKPKG